MEIVIVETQQQAGELVAEAVVALVERKANPVLGVATGSSPGAVYRELGRRVAQGRLSLKDTQAFMLDEYVGLPADHPQRYRTVIDREFVQPTDIDPANVHGPDGSAQEIEQACADYERAITNAGGIDLQILGIGTDGHIAFNEPGSSLGSRTRLKTLTRQTREDNARFFDDDVASVPKHCLTQGVATIMEARHVVLLAFGQSKVEAIHHMVEGSVSAMWPATALQFHPHVTVVLDESAASRLQLASYARQAWEAKPDWQGL
ncbi:MULTISPECIES: glucosamine-6-phosphate deaminase [Kocuria]|uniref:Glucosamine-6-phosphate deaminase n=1 Tax=Kocuria subflava TaxID=1736139 RepID=A0A846U105_9MICC|nr:MULTISPECIES: glucosamine-6-phosphate deaminase [unclassified Kocuria]NKE08391.1 glucosamine-6-phosphate deaminase [Kocuria subflava]